MSNIFENLIANDLHDLIDPVFEIDSYKSKMGDDRDIVVLSFNVLGKDAAIDLVNFVEKGYSYVLDADATAGELENGKYKVFVEIDRTRRIPQFIMEILDGIKRLTGIEKFRFRYYKSFKSITATENAISSIVPTNKNDYEITIKENNLNNFSNFFNKSYLDSILVDDDDIVFQKMYSDPLRMKIQSFGTVNEVYKNIKGRIMLEQSDMAEVLYLTKYLGNYNITKVGNVFVFENQTHAVCLRKL